MWLHIGNGHSGQCLDLKLSTNLTMHPITPSHSHSHHRTPNQPTRYLRGSVSNDRKKTDDIIVSDDDRLGKVVVSPQYLDA